MVTVFGISKKNGLKHCIKDFAFIRFMIFLTCIFIMNLTFIGCSNNSSSDSKNENEYVYDEKAKPVAMEEDLAADESLALTTERNVAMFLTDPDNSISRSWYSDAEERARSVMKKVPVLIEKETTYELSNEHHPDKDQRLHTLLVDDAGNELLSVIDEGAKSIDLVPGKYFVHVGTVADDLQDSHEWPAFLTMEGNRIRALFNGCPRCDLEGLDLRNRTLKKTDFNHANLEGRLTENTQLRHVVAHRSNLLTGRHFDEISQDEHNQSLSAEAQSSSAEDISRSLWGDVTHAVTHPEDTVKKVVHKGEEVVHRTIEKITHVDTTALITVLSPVMEEELPDHDKVLEHRWAKSLSAKYVPVLAGAGALPKVVGMSEVDHTYLELKAYDNEYHDDNETLAFGAFGNNEGGSTLDDTAVKCSDQEQSCIDTKTVAFLMEKDPCKWPLKTGYARVGVCWNLVNRGLYYVGKTVDHVPYYSVIESSFGTYGAEGDLGEDYYGDLTQQYTMSKCLVAQENDSPWGGYDFPGVPAEEVNRSLSDDPESDKNLDPRIKLFNDYRMKGQNIARSFDNNDSLPYLQDLLKLNVKEKIGSVDPQVMDDLLQIHADYLPELNKLRSASELSYESINEIMRAQLEEYRRVLGDEDYMKLMGLDKMEEFDLQYHAPQ